jgi:hypothetical protein
VSELDTLWDHRVNAYMFNGIGAIPVGQNDSWMPYASGGIGMITLRGDLDADDESDFDTVGLPLLDDNQFGVNAGVGIMGFFDQVGFRADVRYFTGAAP